ncbi:MAG: SPOR domain-containing protein [Silicimonas sp.]
MTLTPARLTAAIICSAVGLAGCQELQGTPRTNAGGPEAAAALGPDGARTEIRDIERPDIFGVTETGLWDGRPSLGGIWVAHPDVKDPERAKITNASSGKTVTGALFRRERQNPGPRIQVSSDAAAALGMLAGQPSELSIVVIRQEEVELEPSPLPLSDEGAQTNDSDAEDTEDAAAGAPAVAAGAAVASATADQPEPKGFWGRFRDSLRNKPATQDADKAPDTETAENASVPEVETAPLDPVTTAAVAAIEEAETGDDAPSPPKRPTASRLKNPFIQVGLFSMEENAASAAANLRQAGIVPQIRGQESGGKTLWRVFIGPISTADDQTALLAQIKALGYADAFATPD